MAAVMDAEEVYVTFAVEFHQCIKVANVYITVSQSDKYIDVLVTRRYIQISLPSSNHKKGAFLRRFEMPADTFLPASTSGLSGQYLKLSKNNTDEVTYRTQNKSGPLELTFRVHVNDDAIFQDEVKERNPNVILPPVMIQTEYDLLCRKCYHQLNVSPLLFKRVLEKPSSDWQDLATEWFCHRHSENDGVPSELQKTDLLFGAQTVFLHTELVSVKDTLNDSVVCNRCNSHVGFLTKSRFLNETKSIVLYELLMNSVLFRNVDNMLISEDEPKNAIETVVNLIQAQMEPIMMCKLCLESKGPSASGGSLLLWVTDNTLQRYHAHCDFKSGLQTFTIEPAKVIRVLYSLTECDSPLSLKWRKDFSIDTQSLEDGTFWSIVDHLLDSTRTLPSAHRLMDDLWVGFLPRK